MKLYDSYGNIKDFDKFILAKQDDFKTLCAKIQECIDDKSNKWQYTLENNCFYIHSEATFEYEDGTKKDKVGGIEFCFNFTDGQICNMVHFVADKKDWENGYLGWAFPAKTDESRFLRQSLIEDEYFPELQKIMEKVGEELDIYNKDPYAYNKNLLIVARSQEKASVEKTRSIGLNMQKAGFKNIQAEEGAVSWTDDKGTHKAEVYNNGTFVYEGNIFTKITDFAKAIRKDVTFPEKRYGTKDETFQEYLKTGVLEEKEKGEER